MNALPGVMLNKRKDNVKGLNKFYYVTRIYKHVCKALNNLQRNQTHSEHSQLALIIRLKILSYIIA